MRALILLFSMLIVVSALGQVTGQVQKIGHADWEFIFSKMPEYKKIESDLKIFEGQLQNQIKLKSQELDTKYKAYQTLPQDTTEAIKRDKEAELVYLQENIQKFQQDAQASLQRKQSKLITPVFEKVNKAKRSLLSMSMHT